MLTQLVDGNDYGGFSQDFTFNSNNLGYTFAVPIFNDDDIEPSERFAATLTTNTASNPGVDLDPDRAVVTIEDDDGQFTNKKFIDTNF